MAARSIASLSLSFGLVSIPVRLYSATSASESISFNLLAPDGSRVQQQYVSKATGKVVERNEITHISLMPLANTTIEPHYRYHFHPNLPGSILLHHLPRAALLSSLRMEYSKVTTDSIAIQPYQHEC